MSGISEKTKTTRQFCDELSPSCILDCPLEDKLPQVDCSICEKEKWVRLEDAQQKIAFHVESVKDLLQTKIAALQLTIVSIYKPKIESLERERGEQKQKLQDKAIRLLMLRAGGRYRMFEAGMLYQCLTLLGMQEFTRHEQVEALEQTTCHYLRESDAERQFERLLKH